MRPAFGDRSVAAIAIYLMAVAWLGCGPGGSSGAPTDGATTQRDGGGATSDGAIGSGDGGGSDGGTTTDGGSGSDAGSPDAAVPDPQPFCRLGCTAPVDCDLGTTLHDIDNYACTDNACEWTGCNSTQECIDAFGSAAYVCSTLPQNPLPTCYLSCTAPSQCSLGTPAFDGDNYACTDSKCEWIGCNTTQECIDSFQSPDYVCATAPGASFAACYPTCSVASDCDQGTPAFDGDNYACTDNRCEYLGCMNNAECQGTFMNQSYVCQ